MDVFAGQVFAGLSLGSVLLLAALGSLTFGQLGVINMAHGEFLAIGAHTAYVVQQVVTNAGLSFLLALPSPRSSPACSASSSVGSHFAHARPSARHPPGHVWRRALQQLARDIFGAPNVDVRAPDWLSGPVVIGGLSMPKTRLMILALCVGCVLAVALLLARTPDGTPHPRGRPGTATSLSAAGIATTRVDRLTFFLGSALAGIAGVAPDPARLGPGRRSGRTTSSTRSSSSWSAVSAGCGRRSRRPGARPAPVLPSSSGATPRWRRCSSSLAVVAFLQIRPQGLFTVRTRSLA